MIIIWSIVAILSLFIEIFTFNLVTIWFVIAASFALILNALGVDMYVQIICFNAVSIIMILLIRPFARKFLENKKISTNIDSLIGKEAIVIDNISPLNKGKVRLNGVIWLASSDNEIKTGCVVCVNEIHGVTLNVSKK